MVDEKLARARKEVRFGVRDYLGGDYSGRDFVIKLISEYPEDEIIGPIARRLQEYKDAMGAYNWAERVLKRELREAESKLMELLSAD